MFLWLSALPWSMWNDSHWGVVPITAVVSYLLLGIGELHCWGTQTGSNNRVQLGLGPGEVGCVCGRVGRVRSNGQWFDFANSSLGRLLPIALLACRWLWSCPAPDCVEIVQPRSPSAPLSLSFAAADEIGVQIEEPFGILPLEDVCIDIQSEIDAMMERQDIVTGGHPYLCTARRIAARWLSPDGHSLSSCNSHQLTKTPVTQSIRRSSDSGTDGEAHGCAARRPSCMRIGQRIMT